MILDRGDKLLSIHRRLYDLDPPRYFLGTVLDYFDGIAKVDGNSWAMDPFSGRIIAREGSRIKLISIASGTMILYVLPADSDLDKANFQTAPRGKIVLTDGKALHLDLTESARPAL